MGKAWKHKVLIIISLVLSLAFNIKDIKTLNSLDKIIEPSRFVKSLSKNINMQTKYIFRDIPDYDYQSDEHLNSVAQYMSEDTDFMKTVFGTYWNAEQKKFRQNKLTLGQDIIVKIKSLLTGYEPQNFVRSPVERIKVYLSKSIIMNRIGPTHLYNFSMEGFSNDYMHLVLDKFIYFSQVVMLDKIEILSRTFLNRYAINESLSSIHMARMDPILYNWQRNAFSVFLLLNRDDFIYEKASVTKYKSTYTLDIFFRNLVMIFALILFLGKVLITFFTERFLKK